jgi:hypothetical protein
VKRHMACATILQLLESQVLQRTFQHLPQHMQADLRVRK